MIVGRSGKIISLAMSFRRLTTPSTRTVRGSGADVLEGSSSGLAESDINGLPTPFRVIGELQPTIRAKFSQHPCNVI